MHTYSDVKILPFTPVQMFDLVKDVETYPDFLPWCEGLRITKQMNNKIIADMLVGFKGISEKFTSLVEFDADNRIITVQYKDGPFENLTNVWKFDEVEGGCEVHFDIEFSFKNKMFDIIMAPVFTTIVHKMVGAFSERAKDLYS